MFWPTAICRRNGRPPRYELRDWLVSYADLPEATSLYQRWKRLPEAKNMKLTAPSTDSLGMGGDSYARAQRLLSSITAKGKPDPAAALVKINSRFASEQQARFGGSLSGRRTEKASGV